MSSHTKAFTARKVKPGEQIVATLSGYKGRAMGKGKDAQHNGDLILTDQRVVFYRKGFLGEIFEAIPLDKLTSVETKTLLGHKTLILHTSHDEMEFRLFGAGDLYQSFISELEARRNPKPGNLGAAPKEGTGSAADRIRQLADLARDGLITQAEYETKRQEILTRI